MIGTKFNKPLQDDQIEVQDEPEILEDGSEIPHSHMEANPAPNTYSRYAEAAKWCNEHGNATIEDKGDYYEVVEWHAPEPTLEERQARVRSERDQLMAKSDIPMILDNYEKLSPEEQKNLKAYRQELRDIPQQEVFKTDPESAVFPVQPASIK